MPQPNRQALIEAFDEHGFSRGIGQWMTTNIRRLLPHEERGEGFVWRFDIEGIRALISDYWRVDGWQLLSEIPPNIQLHLLRAERGMRWTEEDARRVAEIRPEAHTPVLADSGHWVHIDQLEALIEMIGQAGL